MPPRKMEQIAFAELQRLRHCEADCRRLRADLDRYEDRLERAKVTIEALQTEIMRRPLRIPRPNDDIPF